MLNVNSVSSTTRGRFIVDVRRYMMRLFSDKRKVDDAPPYQVVFPGAVSAVKDVPEHIEKPDYVTSRLKSCSPRSAIVIHDESMVRRMRETCSLTSHIIKFAKTLIEPGITTDEIDSRIHHEIIKLGAYPSTLLYKGYPKSCCTSVNNVVCHGIPDSTALQNGDIINVDVTVYYLGCHGDSSDTFPVGDIDRNARNLIRTTKDSLMKGVEVCKPGAKFSDIAKAIEPYSESNGFRVCKRFVGHGIGESFHMPPNVHHTSGIFCDRRKIEPGMIFTIEPILMEGNAKVGVAKDGWTVLSKDNLRSAQAEHTVLITENGPDVLT